MTPRVLVPLDVLEGETLSEALVAFLSPVDVVVLGYRVVPEQTSTEQASMQYEQRAQEAVDAVAAAFEAAGRTVETRVAFTHDRDQTIDRVAAEVDATATLLPNPVGAVEHVVVPIRGAIDVDRLADLVATLLADREVTVTLWGLSRDEFDAAAAVERARETLLAGGVPASRVASEHAESATPVRDVVERSGEFDVVVMAEGAESLWSLVFGEAEERVAEGAVAPVLAVRDRPD